MWNFPFLSCTVLINMNRAHLGVCIHDPTNRRWWEFFCGVWLFFGCYFILRGIAGFRMCSNFAVSSCGGQASLCSELSAVPALGTISHAESVCVLCIDAAGEFHLGALGLSNSSHVAEALQ